MRRFGFAAVAAGVLAVSAAGQDAVTISPPQFKAGDRVRVTKTEKTTSSVSFAAAGKAEKKDDTLTRTVVYVDEVLTPGGKGGKPVKLKRTYEKFEVAKGAGGKDEPAPPLNTPIAIEKKGDKYEFTAEKALDKGFADKLTAEFDKASNAEAFLPGKPIKPGETWMVTGDKLKALVGGADPGALDPEKSEVIGKLVKTYQKDGRRFGVIEFNGTVAIKGLGAKVPLAVKAGSGMSLKMTMDGCIDGGAASSDMKGILKVKLDAEGGGVSMSVNADGTITETQELLKK